MIGGLRGIGEGMERCEFCEGFYDLDVCFVFVGNVLMEGIKKGGRWCVDCEVS